MTYLVLAVHRIAAARGAETASCGPDRSIVAPVGASLPVRTIAGHVACIATNAADDVGSVVLLLWAVVLAVANLTAVLAGLVLVITEGTVEGSQLTQLVTLEFVLSFGNGGGL